MAQNPLRIFFAGGGTAGHLFPGLAVAEHLVEQMPDVEIAFAGSGKAMERWHVTAAGLEYMALPCRPAPRRLGELWPALVENYAGYLAARRVLGEEPCAAVIGLGGYASVPMARAALRCGVPLVLLEQNVVPGRATRWLARGAMLVCTAFEETRARLPAKCRVLVTGNPLRREFEAAFDAASAGADHHARRQIVVLGGSGGARALNENVPRALYKISSHLAGWSIVHQSGPDDHHDTASLYQKFALEARVEPFLSDMSRVLANCGLAVCRAGGTTLAELAAAAVPAVLVPYPRAADGHQQKNAALAAAAGACRMVEESDASGRLDEALARSIAELIDNPEKRGHMSAAMAGLARPQAARDVAAIVREIVLTRGARGGSPGQSGG